MPKSKNVTNLQSLLWFAPVILKYFTKWGFRTIFYLVSKDEQFSVWYKNLRKKLCHVTGPQEGVRKIPELGYSRALVLLMRAQTERTQCCVHNLNRRRGWTHVLALLIPVGVLLHRRPSPPREPAHSTTVCVFASACTLYLPKARLSV